MKNYTLGLLFLLISGASAHAHQAFTLVSSQRRSVTDADILAVEKERTVAVKDGTTLTFSQNDIRVLVVTGPEDDMLSYRILGVRNPTLVIPPGATLRILFVNRDGDMRHDVRFGHVVGEFDVTPVITETVGSEKLLARENEGPMQAEELVIKAVENGAYKYFCSVRGHAKGGMWGNILVGVKPGGDLKTPVKTEHVHSADEENGDHEHQHQPAATPTPAGEHKDHQPAVAPAGTDDHKDHQHQPAATPTPSDMAEMPGMDHGAHGEHSGHQMSSVTNLGDPMSRESSGTAWAPDSSPVYAKMKMTDGGGMWMFMGTAFLRYTQIGSSRDVSIAGKGSKAKLDFPTMFMAMYSHPIGERSQFGFRAMASLDPLIEQGFGYPLLFQSGEQFRGIPMHDRQHPHDLISELAVTFSHKFDDKKSFFLYAGLPGEPALGPPMYLHRISGMNNPDAPIGHHWQDATHISYGVVTAGFSFGKAKIEASAFNGTEPNENRWNFDRPRLNSFSARFTVNPTKNLSFQVSHGYLKDPEPLEPEIRILRKTTASAIYNKKFDDERNWASSFVWGQNYANGERSNSFLAESNYDFTQNSVFGRFETVQKSGHDLVLTGALHDGLFRLTSFSAGYIRDIVHGKGLDVGIGGMATLGHNPQALAPVYGGTTHPSWQLFIRFRPSKIM